MNFVIKVFPVIKVKKIIKYPNFSGGKLQGENVQEADSVCSQFIK